MAAGRPAGAMSAARLEAGEAAEEETFEDKLNRIIETRNFYLRVLSQHYAGAAGPMETRQVGRRWRWRR